MRVCVETDPKQSHFVSRNGTPNISAIEARLWSDGKHVSIAAYNRRGIELNAGGVITVEPMDNLALKWIAERRLQVPFALEEVGSDEFDDTPPPVQGYVVVSDDLAFLLLKNTAGVDICSVGVEFSREDEAGRPRLRAMVWDYLAETTGDDPQVSTLATLAQINKPEPEEGAL